MRWPGTPLETGANDVTCDRAEHVHRLSRRSPAARQQLTDHPTSIMKAAADLSDPVRRCGAGQCRVGAQAIAEVFMQAKVPAGRQFWFLDTRVVVRTSFKDGQDRISVLEHEAPHGDSPP